MIIRLQLNRTIQHLHKYIVHYTFNDHFVVFACFNWAERVFAFACGILESFVLHILNNRNQLQIAVFGLFPIVPTLNDLQV